MSQSASYPTQVRGFAEPGPLRSNAWPRMTVLHTARHHTVYKVTTVLRVGENVRHRLGA